MKISIVTPCRNSEKTIRRTIESVVKQNLDGFELEYVIVDGLSTDNTISIIEEFASKYSFIKYISEKDASMTEALNKGMRMTTGDIVASINADDVYLPNALSLVCKEYKKKNCDILMVNTYIVEDGGFVRSHNTPRKFSPIICAFIECPFPECSIFFKRECVEKLGFFNEKVKYTQDLELYIRQYNAGYIFRYADIDVSCFFISKVNYSSTISDEMRTEVTTYISNPLIYKYISGTVFSKLLKLIFRMRHYYFFKKFDYDELLQEIYDKKENK